MANRRSGAINIQANGEVYDAVGMFSYNIGKPLREGLKGPDRVQGYKELPQIPFIEGEIRDSSDLDLATVLSLKDATITLTLANGKTIMLRDAWYANEGTVGTDEANIPFKFEGMSADEIAA